MKALVIGGSSWDTLIHVDEISSIEDDMSLWAKSVIKTVGGTGAGKALCLDSLGDEVTFITNVGRDENGLKIIDFFRETSVNLVCLEVDKSTSHTNLMHSKGKRISVFTAVPSFNPKIPINIDKLIKDSDVIFLNINEFCREYIPILIKHDKLVVVDIHDYNPPNPYHKDFIDIADVVVASGVYIPNHKEFLHQMIQEGKRLAVITKGSGGLVALDLNRNIYELPGYNDFEYVDSNGAGDSFTSGLVSHCFKTKDMGESLKYGTICGGIACTVYDLYDKKFNDIEILDIKKRIDF